MKKYTVTYIHHRPFSNNEPYIEVMTQQELVKLLTGDRIIELISVNQVDDN